MISCATKKSSLPLTMVQAGEHAAVLKALTDECLKATFFEIGEHATGSGDYQAGDRGRHDGRHAYLVAQRSGPESLRQGSEQANRKSRWGTARHMAAAGGKVAPFFRFPALEHPLQLSSYLAERNIGRVRPISTSRDSSCTRPKT